MFKGRVVVKKRIWVTLQNKRLDLCMPKQKGTPEKLTHGNSKFTQDIADTICEAIATSSKGLRAISKKVGVDYGTVKRWLLSNENFRTQYARAKEEQAEHMEEEMVEIADDGTNDTYVDGEGNTRTDYDVIARSKLRVDTRKWIASKLKPKKYGDKTDITSGGNEIKPMAFIVTTTDPELAKDANDFK